MPGKVNFMSKAGIQSNRGDGYQTLVAFDWALTVLSDHNFQWLEVDSVTSPVDDVVVGKADGARICCQCKKNQSEHKAWSISDLKDELDKAIQLLTEDPKVEIRFYSRSPFGDLAAIRELSTNFSDESAYKTHLGELKGNVQRSADHALKHRLTEKNSKLSTYLFLIRTRFEVSPDLDRMKLLLFERLGRLVSNPTAAFDTLWTCLDHLGQRESVDGLAAVPRHRLTKGDLKALLEKAGSVLILPKEIGEIRNSFTSTSAIGRTWRRDIGNECIANPVVIELLDAIKSKLHSILLVGAPGSGKTCVVLDVQDELERIAQTSSDLIPLFIQSREFADFATAQDRKAQGLPEQWVEGVARMADDAHVVVVIDSLDVLSIAREHNALTYFLAQIDRLLLVPNVTVVTACREFDARYDPRIAQRQWDRKVTCEPLNWDAEVVPLLGRLNIDSSTIDEATRELICNPRELSLFVELARSEGSFNVVSSQALAQHYLEIVVGASPALGDAALQVLEGLAVEMLHRRSLSIPPQRFTASSDIKRGLLSNNVLHETTNSLLTFGHQTLLDVLVVSNAIRQEISLNEFIAQLPPVPFVRPSIRSFVAQLAAGNRVQLRKQLRTVLTGDSAFHIRRLVAETFVEQMPHDDDWPLLRDLHNGHREIFQVIYLRARRAEWHQFWMKYLVPLLKDSRDVEGLIRHAHRISEWKNEDAAGVVAFWTEILAMGGTAKESNLVNSIGHAINEIDGDYLPLCEPLLMNLLEFPRQEYGAIGYALARCIKNGCIGDELLWDYVAGDVGDDDVSLYNLNNKLHCQLHEFGNGNEKFLFDRMQESTKLLELAISAIERWSKIRCPDFGDVSIGYWAGFLNKTSYRHSHEQNDIRSVDSIHILMNAVENAVVKNARDQSDWWKNNRERLCFSREGALLYFAIVACTKMPVGNYDVVGRMLSGKSLLESSLSFELGTLMQSTFLYLDAPVQDAIQAAVLDLHADMEAECSSHRSFLQAQLILAIPCHLRSHEAQLVLIKSEKEKWPLLRRPEIHSSGGWVSAPFSYDIFLNATENGILRLLNHYNGSTRSFDEFLQGGEREVGFQLREAASRCPARFIDFLSAHCAEIPECFRDDIMEGIATYLACRYGNLTPNQGWEFKEDPNPHQLVTKILDELESHYWYHNRATSSAIEGCAHVVLSEQDAARIVSLADRFIGFDEESSVSGDSVGLLTAGLNMAKGKAADALMVLANRIREDRLPLSETLENTLRRFAGDYHPAVRALMLRRMPFLQQHYPEFGWELFDIATQNCAPGIWEIGERCLYCAYHHKFDLVAPRLARLTAKVAIKI